MNQTPLLPYYPAARLVAFAGWQMAVFYDSLLQEHLQVRQQAGVFDVSHMGKFLLTAPIAEVELLTPTNLSLLAPGQAQYTLLLNEAAGILDDVIFYRLTETSWRIIVNAATKSKDFDWIARHLSSGQLVDQSEHYLLLALQGPQAIPLLQTLSDQDLTQIPRFGHQTVALLGQPAWIARTGYTGEDGFEILLPPDPGIALGQKLLGLGVAPCGLGARDSLRLEAAMHLYGQDMDEQTNPLEAGLGWVIDWQKENFLGKSALVQLKAAGVPRRLVGLEMTGRGIARHGYPIGHEQKEIGTITSGGPAPFLQRNIALGYVPVELSKPGTELTVLIRNQPVSAVVVKRPFYRRALV